MVLFTKLLTDLYLSLAHEVILSMVLFTKLLTHSSSGNAYPMILSMVLFTKLLTVKCNIKGTNRF